MPLAIANFSAAYPDVELSLAEGEPEEIVPRLRAGELDLALLFEFPDDEPLGGGDDAASSCSRTRCTWRCRASTRSRGAPPPAPRGPRRRGLGADLAASPCSRHVVRAATARGFEPRVSFESDDYQTVQGLVAAGVGVALIPQLALTRVRGRSSACARSTPGARRGEDRRRDPEARGTARSGGDAHARGARRGRARLPDARPRLGRVAICPGNIRRFCPVWRGGFRLRVGRFGGRDAAVGRGAGRVAV